MSTSAGESARIRARNDRAVRRGDYVLYWMQQSQRAHFNPALEYAVERANELSLPVLVAFGITDGYPEANLRHYTFMVEGLHEVGLALEKRGVAFVLQHGDPAQIALALGRHAALIVCDRGYLAPQKAWRQRVADEAECAVLEVEGDVVVPVAIASEKARVRCAHFAAKADSCLAGISDQTENGRGESWTVAPRPSLPRLAQAGDHPGEAKDRSFGHGGDSSISAAGRRKRCKIFRHFCTRLFRDYKENRNQPQTNNVSHMSKYLHFGQISPIWLALEARKYTNAGEVNVASFIDELLVRRELSMNWVEHTEHYERYECLPEWCRKTLAEHARDPRPYLYSREQLESGATHDPYWNAAMKEMRVTGYMHNHMRMYWGKKILEWMPSPEEAHATALAINNKFFLDGRDANSFANIAWVFGQHDRPWFERPVFGKIRYMNAAGLERKCDIKSYVAKVDALVARASA